MRRFMILMHNDTTTEEDGEAWGRYLEMLRATGNFEGGSSTGRSTSHNARGEPKRSSGVVGYLIVGAQDLAAAHALLDDNPTYLAGGTIEICELVED